LGVNDAANPNTPAQLGDTPGPLGVNDHAEELVKRPAIRSHVSVEIDTPLPRDGVGFRSYKTADTQYGYPTTVEFILALGAEWAKVNASPRLLIGDISIKGGGPTPKQWDNPGAGYHKSHGSGLDFDVQIIRLDGLEKPRSVSVKDPLYDRPRTQTLVSLIRQIAGKRFGLILSADTQLKGIHRDDSHIYHLHVRLKRD
jgi:hypothetical protein